MIDCLSLSDEQMTRVRAAAALLRAESREAFLQALADYLSPLRSHQNAAPNI